MAGDVKQLGPIIKSTTATQNGLKSWLERLMGSNKYKHEEPIGYNKSFIVMLKDNYRSHPALLTLPSKLFYDNLLIPCASGDEVSSCLNFSGLTEQARGKIPLVVHGITGPDLREDLSPSYYNPYEISIVVDYVKKLKDHGINADDVAIICPYNKQCEKLEQLVKQETLGNIEIGSVERFQGREKKVIIITTTRGTDDFLLPDGDYYFGFLKSARRFNVAITRAKSLLIIVGNPTILKQA